MLRQNWSPVKNDEKVTASKRMLSPFGATNWRGQLINFEKAIARAAGKEVDDTEKLTKFAERRAAKVLFGLKQT